MSARVSKTTSLPGRLVLLGHPVGHSLSPVFQDAALAAAGIPLRYEAEDVPPASWPSALARFAAERAAGNVTVPHKRRMFEACVRRSAIAERVGAVNTFWCEADGLVGDNTDVHGFRVAAEMLVADGWEGRAVALLGAGGAASAVCAAVEASGGRVVVHARSPEAAMALAARFPRTVRVAADLAAALVGARLLVNATPLGLHPGDALPLDVARLPASLAVLDLGYRRTGTTALVEAASARGLRAADGREMLLAQGALAFERWFGVAPDHAAMRAALAAAA